MRLPHAAAAVSAVLVAALAPAMVPSATATGAAPDACRAGHVALTFDDGPSATVTPRLLDTLHALDVPATFFMVGERVVAAPATARLVERSGFLVANHSYRHEDLTRLSDAQIVASIEDTDAALRAAGVHPTRLMRPPYGAVDARVEAAIRSTHLRPVLWDVDPRDWAGGTADQIAARILGQLHPGDDVVLQHDGVRNSPSSVAAVPQVVREARRRGFCFVALDEHGRPGFPTPTAHLSAPAAVAEGHRLAVTVTLDAVAGRPTSVRLRAPGARRDLGRFDRVVRLPAGATSAVVRVRVREDGLHEGTEPLTVTLGRAHGVRPDGADAVVQVADADPPPAVTGQPTAVVEPAAGSVAVPVTFTLDRPSTRPVTLSVATVAGTADAADFAPLATTLTVPPCATSAVVPVTVLADAQPEPPETFVVRVLGATGARVGTPDAVVTINPS